MRRGLRLLPLIAVVAAVPLPALAARHGVAKQRSKAAHLHFGKPHARNLPRAGGRPATPVKQPTTRPPGGATTPPRSTTPPPVTRLSVRADEYSLVLSSNPISAGDALVELANAGEDAHDLRIAPVGGSTDLAIFPPTPAGERTKLRFKLAPGTYEVYCSVLDHRDRGMDAVLTVE